MIGKCINMINERLARNDVYNHIQPIFYFDMYGRQQARYVRIDWGALKKDLIKELGCSDDDATAAIDYVYFRERTRCGYYDY